MLKDKILIYDDHCPLCSWYSGLFVKFGFLPSQGRKAFSELENSHLVKIDFERGKNEIPLLDRKTGEVHYGLDSLLLILDDKIPLINKIGHCKPLNWFFTRFYKFISYNRKVIVARKCGPGRIDCTPEFNYFYRILFMAVFMLFNTIMLSVLYQTVFSRLSIFSLTGNDLQGVHFGLIFINCMLALTLPRKKAIEYLGQVNMLALITILLLTPLIFIQFLLFHERLVEVYLIISTVIVFREYIRRMYYADVLLTNKWLVSLNLVSIAGFILLIFG